MIGLQSGIKVTVIRNAAGSQMGSTQAGCRTSAPTYFADGRCSTEQPSSCGANTYNIYDPSQPRKVINVMNFFGAPSSDFLAFDRNDLENSLDLNCELEKGAEIICIWKPLLVFSPQILINGITPFSSANAKIAPAASVAAPIISQIPGDATSPTSVAPGSPTILKRPPKTNWLPTYGVYFKPPEA